MFTCDGVFFLLIEYFFEIKIFSIFNWNQTQIQKNIETKNKQTNRAFKEPHTNEWVTNLKGIYMFRLISNESERYKVYPDKEANF